MTFILVNKLFYACTYVSTIYISTIYKYVCGTLSVTISL